MVGGGSAKKNRRNYPYHPAFFFLTFVLSTFLGVSRQGEFKNTITMFLQKVMSKTNQKFRQNFRCQFFHDFFCYRVFGYFSAMGVQKQLQRAFYKKITKKNISKRTEKNMSKTKTKNNPRAARAHTHTHATPRLAPCIPVAEPPFCQGLQSSVGGSRRSQVVCVF
jgi:hypothetical protein